MSHNYWNNFVDNWRNLPNAEFANLNPNPQYVNLGGWQNPNLTPLMNSDNQGDYSLQYLPEPWWGNNGDQILNSVVLNYNPGFGQGIQHVNQVSALFGFNTYRDFVSNECAGATTHFSHTTRWHRAQRATRVLNALTRLGQNLNGHNNLQNHLSIELIPWHTTDIQNISGYIANHLQMIYENSIVFAANESRRINNDTLQNKVLLKINGNTTVELLNQLTNNGICTFQVLNNIGYTPNQRGGYLKFQIHQIPDVQFISIWQTTFAGFPSNENMDWIFEHIV